MTNSKNGAERLAAAAASEVRARINRMTAYDVPVVLIAFKRPEETTRVLEQIRELRPQQLFVICDGPRNPKEAEDAAATRTILDNIDWPCEVRRNYSEENLGLRRRIESGLDWVFSQVDRAIILEDDCVPHPTFFRFCREMLEYHKTHDDVAMISGDNAHGYHPRGESYYWSRYILIWGWATWAHAWARYNHGQTLWPAARDSHFLTYMFRSRRAVAYWTKVLQDNYVGGNSWARVWLLSNWVHETVCAVAGRNLISNIGFGDAATHTRGSGDPVRAFPNTEPMQFQLVHPVERTPNDEADALADHIIFSRDPEIFQDQLTGASPEVSAIPLHAAYRREGLSGTATNALLASYFSNHMLDRTRFHLCTAANRIAFARQVLELGDDNPYLIDGVDDRIDAWLGSVIDSTGRAFAYRPLQRSGPARRPDSSVGDRHAD